MSRKNILQLARIDFDIFFRKIVSSLKPEKLNHAYFGICDIEDETLYLGKSESEKTSTFYKVLYLGTKNEQKIEAFLEDHMKPFKFDSEAKTTICARSIYNLSDPSMVGSENQKSSVKLRLKWLKPKCFREIPPERATQVELLINIFFKDERSSCQNMLQELNLLKNFQSGLQNQGIQWREKLPNEDLNIIEELHELLTEVKNQGPRPSGKNLKTQSKNLAKVS